MNPTRTSNRSSRARSRAADSARGGSRFSSTASTRSAAPARSGGSGRPASHGRRPAAVQGEFALPVTLTPALPAVEAFADLDMPGQLLAALTRG